MTYIYNSQNNSKKIYKLFKNFSLIKNQRILAFSPHSDDLSIGAGGFLSLLAQDNEIKPVLAFSGWRGVRGVINKATAIRIREREMKKEAKELGLMRPIFLHLASYEDSEELEQEQKLISTKKPHILNRVSIKNVCKPYDRKICKHSNSKQAEDLQRIKNLISQFQAQVIFLPNHKDDHPRHRLLSKLCLRAIKELNVNCKLFFYEVPWTIFSKSEFNFLVPLNNLNLKKKISAIKMHKSQLARTNFIRLAKAILAWRASATAEQIIGFGCDKIDLGNWLEVFRYKKIN